ncbi:hypothetical protein [Mucilaginibacter paludis]|uniref:hypothetical protein n=1 Tax=Mucilaginibacter paludis TaxID=423351 RepID=UPI0002555C99|nr:hypothetical protein [Mucilaginibacter paludis]
MGACVAAGPSRVDVAQALCETGQAWTSRGSKALCGMAKPGVSAPKACAAKKPFADQAFWLLCRHKVTAPAAIERADAIN